MSKSQVTVIENHPSVRRSTGVVFAEGLRPRRIVLREQADQFIVHREYLTVSLKDLTQEGHTYEAVVLNHEDFDQGDYFNFGPFSGVERQDALNAAVARFDERSKRV